ncbi:DUF881 domain-containing protein [Bacillus salacetis]|uniref:DUF881 domain-containing protein n=2 Tax=Bacillus salacetis TaxID=2315464 RepID=A0A3A1R323_9BACI|nr:DUF881 domain-containing protein [Bacillus salacetis]
MVAVQFQTVQEPVIRDTRDIWELREAIEKEKDIHSGLLKEMQSIDEKLEKYETERQTSQEQALRDTLEELKLEAGLLEKSGPGLVLTVEPSLEEVLLGTKVKSVSPDLLERLVNELNQYGAKEISIDGRRLINTSVIRDINGETKIDGYSINTVPFEIRVLTKDLKEAQDLQNRMQVSRAIEDFFIDNLTVNIGSPMDNLTVPAYGDTIRIRYMEPVAEGGN